MYSITFCYSLFLYLSLVWLTGLRAYHYTYLTPILKLCNQTIEAVLGLLRLVKCYI